MLETIREYAHELLERTDEAAEVRSRHVDHVLALVEQAEPQLTGPDQREWYECLTLEQDNVREALAYACDTGDAERVLMLAGTIWRFWWTRAAMEEPAHWYGRAFAVAGEASNLARARAIFGAAHVAEARGDNELAEQQFKEAADRFRLLGETRWLILALTHLATAHRRLGDPVRGELLNREALELALRNGDVRGAAVIRGNMAFDLLAVGEEERARGLLQEALEGSRTVGDVYMIASCLMNLASIDLRAGESTHAADNLRESLELFSSIGDRRDLAAGIAVTAAAVLSRGDAGTSARLSAAAKAICESHGFELDPAEQRVLDEAVTGARRELAEDFEDAWATGAELDPGAAVELALKALS
jgi:tetratricopeptide (TPR) repeat protein